MANIVTFAKITFIEICGCLRSKKNIGHPHSQSQLDGAMTHLQAGTSQ